MTSVLFLFLFIVITGLPERALWIKRIHVGVADAATPVIEVVPVIHAFLVHSFTHTEFSSPSLQMQMVLPSTRSSTPSDSISSNSLPRRLAHSSADAFSSIRMLVITGPA